jgi:hypothetical protein
VQSTAARLKRSRDIQSSRNETTNMKNLLLFLSLVVVSVIQALPVQDSRQQVPSVRDHSTFVTVSVGHRRLNQDRGNTAPPPPPNATGTAHPAPTNAPHVAPTLKAPPTMQPQQQQLLLKTLAPTSIAASKLSGVVLKDFVVTTRTVPSLLILPNLQTYFLSNLHKAYANCVNVSLIVVAAQHANNNNTIGLRRLQQGSVVQTHVSGQALFSSQHAMPPVSDVLALQSYLLRDTAVVQAALVQDAVVNITIVGSSGNTSNTPPIPNTNATTTTMHSAAVGGGVAGAAVLLLVGVVLLIGLFVKRGASEHAKKVLIEDDESSICITLSPLAQIGDVENTASGVVPLSPMSDDSLEDGRATLEPEKDVRLAAQFETAKVSSSSRVYSIPVESAKDQEYQLQSMDMSGTSTAVISTHETRDGSIRNERPMDERHYANETSTRTTVTRPETDPEPSIEIVHNVGVTESSAKTTEGAKSSFKRFKLWSRSNEGEVQKPTLTSSDPSRSPEESKLPVATSASLQPAMLQRSVDNSDHTAKRGQNSAIQHQRSMSQDSAASSQDSMEEDGYSLASNSIVVKQRPALSAYPTTTTIGIVEDDDDSSVASANETLNSDTMSLFTQDLHSRLGFSLAPLFNEEPKSHGRDESMEEDIVGPMRIFSKANGPANTTANGYNNNNNPAGNVSTSLLTCESGSQPSDEATEDDHQDLGGFAAEVEQRRADARYYV